jgi:hypothetical protein
MWQEILSWFFWAIGAKRCHDTIIGWYNCSSIFDHRFSLVPYELGLVRGNPWPNRFGFSDHTEGISEEDG